MQRLLLSLILLVSGYTFAAHALTVSGRVSDPAGEPLPGASVTAVANGTKLATVTDIDGMYTLKNVNADSELLFSSLGYSSQKVRVAGRTRIDVTLKEDASRLDEVVVVGYGTAKAKDLTSPISTVSGAEIANSSAQSPMAALQGRVAGVTIFNNGAPGSGPTVRVRGTGSFGAASPLFVVDGMFFDDINFLNPDDIKDISVLKDASAAAIYGVKAANGVVLITTKTGMVNMPAKITYNGYVGMETVQQRLAMANSHEYATMMTEADKTAYMPVLKKSAELFGGDINSLTFNADTDWYNELLRNAFITNHGINVAGGSSNASYSVGVNYLFREGIMKSDNNNYKRLNFRGRLDYKANNWLKVGFSGLFSNGNLRSPNNSAWQVAYNAPAIFPVMDERRSDEVFPVKYASPTQIGIENNIYNPVATANAVNSKVDHNRFNSNFYAQFFLVPDKLDFRTSYANTFMQGSSVSVSAPYFVAVNQRVTESSVSKTQQTYKNYIWDNILTYNQKFGSHKVGAMLGYSMRQDTYNMLYGTANKVPTDKPEYWYINNGDGTTTKANDGGFRTRGQSAFARLNYDFDGKYILAATFRADGSSKYQEKWGYFPSVGAAWVISDEDFMKQASTPLNFLKLRASWGILGNDGVAASDGFASITTGNGVSGVYGNALYPGYIDNIYFSWLRWERVMESNVGVSAAAFNNRLSLELDYYNRLTRDAVISAKLPFENGTLAGNYGRILNEGVDVALNWNDRAGGFKYWLGANASYLHNVVKSLSGSNIIFDGAVANIKGQKMNQYYGYRVIGIFQTPEEVAANPIGKANNCQPGDLIYEDVDGDGQLTGQDRVGLGSYIPDLTYSFNLGFEYKNFDVTVNTYGQAGSKLFNRKRALRYASSYYNFDKAQYTDRWTGPGSTNTNPSAAALFKSYTTQAGAPNSYYVESADFFRLQSITLGYTINKIKMGAYTMPKLRVSVNADRPYTFFKAHAFTPEIADGKGWDTEVYPLASSYTLGVQIEF